MFRGLYRDSGRRKYGNYYSRIGDIYIYNIYIYISIPNPRAYKLRLQALLTSAEAPEPVGRAVALGVLGTRQAGRRRVFFVPPFSCWLQQSDNMRGLGFRFQAFWALYFVGQGQSRA